MEEKKESEPAVKSDDSISSLSKFFSSTISSMHLNTQQDKEAFQQFSSSRTSPLTTALATMLTFSFAVYFYSMVFQNPKDWHLFVATLILTVLVRVPLFITVAYVEARQYTKSPFVTKLIPWLRTLENILAISSCFSVGICLIARSMNGECDEFDEMHVWACDAEKASGTLPQAHLMLLMMYPIVYSVVFKSIKWEYVVASWMIVIVCIVASICISDATQSITCIVLYVPLSLIVMYENHRQNLILFFVMRRQHQLLTENRDLNDQAQSELRHMIANVAHDLKTPLSAFMSGVETISSQLTDLQTTQQQQQQQYSSSSKSNAASDVSHTVSLLQDTLRNLFNINSFMIMTINRCIDYTKASKGMKLDPRFETIHLQDIITLPLNCMKDLQTRIRLSLDPIPLKISSHIITDKQWLQENLFCLISNAVKYSSSGSVNISVSLTSTSTPLITAAAIVRANAEDIAQPRQRKPSVVRTSEHDRESVHSAHTLGNGSVTGTENRYFYMDRLHGHANKSAYLSESIHAGSEDVNAADEPSGVTSPSQYRKKGADKKKVSFSMFAGNTQRKIHASFEGDEAAAASLRIKSAETSTDRFPAQLLLFEVEDTGIGLSPEVMATLFSPFRQAMRRAGGTGLGLYSLAKRVQALDGFYGVRNRKDGLQGSVFWFAIPYKPDQTSVNLLEGTNAVVNVPPTIKETTSAKQQMPPSALSKSSQPVQNPVLRVLIVDDSVSILKMTGMMLKRQGHFIDQAENGAEALLRIAEQRALQPESASSPYDIVLMDLNMPVMDGLEATSRLRREEAAHNSEQQLQCVDVDAVGDFKDSSASNWHQCVIAFSANSDHQCVTEAYGAGVDDFISKPFAMQTFYDTYNRYQAKKNGQ